MPKLSLHLQIKSGKLKVNVRSPISHRFWAKVNKDGPVHPVLKTKCWIWTGYCDKDGYGQFHFEGGTGAHRYSWILHNGEIPLDKSLICHECDNPSCVRPSHLKPGTHQDNITDMIQKGRANKPTGDRHGSRTKPESVPKGDRHYLRTNPEKIIRGDRHGLRKHPEKAARGDASGARQHPEKVPRGEIHGNAKLIDADILEIRRRSVTGESQGSIADYFNVSQTTISEIKLRKTWKHVK